MKPTKHRFPAIFFLLFLSRICFAQTGTSSDNRQFIIHWIDTLNYTANQTVQVDRFKAKENAMQALYLAEQIHYFKGQAEACEMIGMYFAGSDEFEEALKMYVRFLEIEKQLGNTDDIIRGNLRIAAMYLDLQNFELAENYIENAFILALIDGKDKNLGWVYFYKGIYYYSIKEYTAAMNAALKEYTYFIRLNDPEMLGRSEKLVGDIYVEEGKLDEALQAYDRAIEQFNKTNFYNEKGNILTRIAHVYQQKNDLSAVLSFNLQALYIRESLGHLILISHSLVNIGKTYSMMGQSDSALYYYQRGIEVALESENNFAIQHAYYQLASLYETIGDYRKAMEYSHLHFESYQKYSEEHTKSEIFAFEVKSQLKSVEAQNQLLKQKIAIQSLELRNQSYSELITQLIIGTIVALLLLLVYIFERNKLGKSRLEIINQQLNREVDERKLTEVQLRISEELYRFVTGNTLDLIVQMDRNLNYLYFSPSLFRMFGYNPEDKDTIPSVQEIIPGIFHKELQIQYIGMIRNKEPAIFTHQSRRKDGSLFWSESLVNPIFNPVTGTLQETITVIRDITDRMAFEESLAENARQKELLLREIHHRVKNNFAILVSLLNMQKFNSDHGNSLDFLTSLQGRIRTMSLVHELLYRSNDLDYIHFGEYLNQLVSIISRAYNDKPVKINASIESCILDVETALPLGLISNEILTNSFKYAFADNPEAELWIDLKRNKNADNSGDPFTHTLTIRDNGPGLPKGFSADNQKSMGSQIIELLIDQLEGQLHYSGEGGASFTIYFSDEKRL
ncbi:MAG: PAS domain S-box protein [Bacteroidales bacterium]|nr:PAS domain S-box protein [Bacteroidales bacterium]